MTTRRLAKLPSSPVDDGPRVSWPRLGSDTSSRTEHYVLLSEIGSDTVREPGRRLIISNVVRRVIHTVWWSHTMLVKLQNFSYLHRPPAQREGRAVTQYIEAMMLRDTARRAVMLAKFNIGDYDMTIGRDKKFRKFKQKY